MSNKKKRTYVSQTRKDKANLTKTRILESAKILFQEQAIEKTTIDQIATRAQVSTPTIYALFQSKRGILRTLIDHAIPVDVFESLAKEAACALTSQERLCVSAKMARQIYDAERAQMDSFWGVYVLTPEFKEIEQERERRRYIRQEETIQKIKNHGDLIPDLSLEKARDILWSFTGRDLYRLLVVDKCWPSQEYEKWISLMLHKSLLKTCA